MTCQKGESSTEQNICCKRSGQNTCPGHNNNACKKVHRMYTSSYHRQLSCEKQKTIHHGKTCKDGKPLEEQSRYYRRSYVKAKCSKVWSKKPGYLNCKGKNQKTVYHSKTCQEEKSLEDQSRHCKRSSVTAKCSKVWLKKIGYLNKNCKVKRKHLKLAEYSKEKRKTVHRGKTCQYEESLKGQSRYCRRLSVKAKCSKVWSKKLGYLNKNGKGKIKKTVYRSKTCQGERSLEDQSSYCKRSSVRAKCSKVWIKKIGYLNKNCKVKGKHLKMAEYSKEKRKTVHHSKTCQEDKSLEEQSRYCKGSSVRAKCAKVWSKKIGYLNKNSKGNEYRCNRAPQIFNNGRQETKPLEEDVKCACYTDCRESCPGHYENGKKTHRERPNPHVTCYPLLLPVTRCSCYMLHE